MPKRKTRSVNIDVDETAAREIGLPKRKRFRNKNSCVTKLSFDEPDLLNNHVDDPASIASKAASFDQQEDVNDRENSPSPLVIDTGKEMCPTQSMMSDYFPPTEPLGERLPRTTSNTVEKTRSNTLNGPTFVMSDRNHCHIVDSVNNERSRENNTTPIINRSTESRFSSSIRSQSSSLGIVVSVDQRRQISNGNSNYNQRTSTPIRPSHQSQTTIGLVDDCIDSFTVDSISRDTYDMLSRFPEFRRLVKAFNNEKKKCLTWSKDFTRLQTNYKKLEENSFPRPSAAALSYLVDLVTQIQQSGGRGDPRSDEEIANDLGETRIFLMGLKDVTPQQTALNLFNHLYPGYEAKMRLNSVNKLEIEKPGLLETILVFAQRSAPGTNYKLQELKDALNNSIRGARYHWRRINGMVAHAVAVNDGNDNDEELIDD